MYEGLSFDIAMVYCQWKGGGRGGRHYDLTRDELLIRAPVTHSPLKEVRICKTEACCETHHDERVTKVVGWRCVCVRACICE